MNVYINAIFSAGINDVFWGKSVTELMVDFWGKNVNICIYIYIY